MKKIYFTKMVGAGNDFVVIDGHKDTKTQSYRKLAIAMCDRKFGIGADGLLVLEKAPKIDVRMRIFNADGSEAEMCGNGSRCAALYTALKLKKHDLDIRTLAGLIRANVRGDNVKVQLTDPAGLRLDMAVKLGRTLRVNFINTGVPHAVVFVDSVENIDVPFLGRRLRFHKSFAPKGTNVDFVEIVSPAKISVRTYERGVEDETLACGTGVMASALVSALKLGKLGNSVISVTTRGGETLKVYFNFRNNRFSEVWLEGRVSTICQGVYHV
ncbi:MAG: diaminopimelate epimerase [Candidatus Omnitrophota bacterium]